MKAISGFRELYDYLVALATELRQQGAVELSEAVDHARRCSASNISTEFLGESRTALKQVAAEENGLLTEQQRSDLMDILAQIDNAFDNR
jgi:hypothetical protein